MYSFLRKSRTKLTFVCMQDNISFTALFSNLHANYLCCLSACRLRGYVFISELPFDYCSHDHGENFIARQNCRTKYNHILSKNIVFWGITPCSPLEANRSLRGTCHLHLIGRRISQAKSQSESRCQTRPT
jgi:hypothetical protein